MAAETEPAFVPLSFGTLGTGLGTVRRAGTMSRGKDKGQALMPSVPAGDTGSILYIYSSWCVLPRPCADPPLFLSLSLCVQG
jgi:hypothetical protein